ncbi:MAG TPA: hypothetical protein PLK28_15400 [Candidatus Rifleibacterium sp.]|nr:hypothetical protein [Candidatus Rifleibacterium sp.]
MTSALVFNHHSLPFDSISDAENSLADFLKMCLDARNSGISPVLVDADIDKSWFRIELARGYFWQDWYQQNKNGYNKDMIAAFRSIATHQPFFDESNIAEAIELFEVALNGDTNLSALKAAAWHDVPLVSFPTREPWNSTPVTVEVRTLEEDAQLTVYSKDLLNFFSHEQFIVELEHLARQIRVSVESGVDLFENRQTSYPALFFCGKSEEQLLRWSAGITLLNQVAEALNSLNFFCVKWQNGFYQDFRLEYLRENGLSHHVSGESDSVKQNPELRKHREFFLPTGQKKLFEHHIKLAKGYRLHFYADQNGKTIYVGYIGPHLRLK